MANKTLLLLSVTDDGVLHTFAEQSMEPETRFAAVRKACAGMGMMASTLDQSADWSLEGSFMKDFRNGYRDRKMFRKVPQGQSQAKEAK